MKHSGRRVLQDHKQVGKTFLPPFTALLGTINEVSWVGNLLPELLWLGLLDDLHGLTAGVRLGVALGTAADRALDSPHDKWLQFTSQYRTISHDGWGRIVDSLDRPVRQALREALRPLVALYPECPLRPLWGDEKPQVSGGDLHTVRRVVDVLLDRSSKSASVIQATAVEIMFATNKLTVFRGSVLARLDAVVDYPETEESRRLASGLRAAINGFGRDDVMSDNWAPYFWRRGVELSPCEFRSPV